VLQDECASLLEREDIREFYLGQKDAGIRGARRWKRKKLWR
jgi:branched-chain amino acid transport system ATP-binding protein